jgi:hypothetical protein
MCESILHKYNPEDLINIPKLVMSWSGVWAGMPIFFCCVIHHGEHSSFQTMDFKVCTAIVFPNGSQMPMVVSNQHRISLPEW